MFVPETRGVADIVAGGEAAARDRAIRNAERLAVERLGTNITSTTLVVNFELVEDIIRSETPGRYVQVIDILDEGTERAIYFVVLNACVSEQEVRTELESIGAIVRQDLGNPKLTILAQDGESKAVAEAARSRLQDHFVGLGFDVRSGEEDAHMVVRVGAEAITDPTIVENLFSSRVTLQITATLSTGQVVVSLPVPSAPPEVSSSADIATQKAMESALSLKLEDITNEIVTKLNTSFEVVFHALPDFSTYVELEFILESLRGVDDIQPQEFSEGRGVFSGQGSARTRDIAGVLDKQSLQLHPNLRLEVVSQSLFLVEFKFGEIVE